MVAFWRTFTVSVYSRSYRHSPLSLEQIFCFSRAPQTSASIYTVKPPQHEAILKYFVNATFQNLSLKSEKTQLDLVCINISPKTSLVAEEIICCTRANFL